MAYTAGRVTLYALIIAIEEDLREVISNQIIPQVSFEEILDHEAVTRLKKRYQDDTGIDNKYSEELIYYLDITQLDQIINSNSNFLPTQLAKYFKSVTKELQTLYKTRNRIMYGRPLEFDDLAKVTEFAKRRLRDREFNWTNLTETANKIKNDPNYLFTVNIPETTQAERIANNLPLPDYDETGFIGRAEIIKSVKTAMNADWPVVTLIGDGGQGKTALGLKIAYEILDNESADFDAIIWTTAKANRMGIKEITAIEGAITDSLGIFKDISHSLIGVSAREYIDEIIEYLSQFKILLIIDNLETVLDEQIKDFLRRLPKGSKVLITTRISLGAYEFPVKIGAMSDSDAIQLIRSLAAIRGIDHLFKIDNKELMLFINKMHNNPGYIKWFVTAIQSGMRPEDALQSADFLDFCMSNVYQYLDEDAKYTLSAFQSLTGTMSYAEISYITEFNPATLQKSLNDLQRTNMITTVSDAKITDSETQYTVSEFARAYLRSRHSVKDTLAKIFLSRKRKLTAEFEETQNNRISPYSPKTIRATTRSEIVAGRLLKKALEFEDAGDIESALEHIEEAKNLVPTFFEVYRIEAWVKSRQGDTIGANECYERAIEYKPDYAPVRFFYGNFLMFNADDLEEAIKVFKFAESLVPNDPEIKLQIARCYLYMRDFQSSLRCLNETENISKRNSLMTKKLYDLKLQCFVRRAEFESRNHQKMEALSTLEELKDTYLEIPNHHIDSKMKDNIRKMRQTLDWLYRQNDDKISKWANELTNWLRTI